MSVTASNDNTVIVGRIGAPYGISGSVKLQSFMDEQDEICSFNSLFIKKGNKDWQTVEVLNIRQHGKAFALKLKGINDRDQAALLTNSDVAVSKDVFPELPTDEYYWFELLELEVFDENQKKLGVVTDLLETGANDVLVVTEEGSDSKEHLIPYVPEQYVLDIDLENKKILVAWEDLGS